MGKNSYGENIGGCGVRNISVNMEDKELRVMVDDAKVYMRGLCIRKHKMTKFVVSKYINNFILISYNFNSILSLRYLLILPSNIPLLRETFIILYVYHLTIYPFT